MGLERASHAAAARTTTKIGDAERILEHDVAKRENFDVAHNE